MIIRRKILEELKILLTEYPVVTILGPRQAGKTTLVKKCLEGYSYSNLELPDVRRLAVEDPKAYLARLKFPVIIDEIQRVPELLSYIQVLVDENSACGQFILTGSYQLHLHNAVNQSLAGRTAILNLLPLSISELRSAEISYECFEDYCFKGFLPRIHAEHIRPRTVYANYFRTYVERDVRLLINLKDVSLFEKMLHLLAGRTGQVMDYTSLANDVGVDQKTIKNWLSILEASFIVYKLPPFYENFGKRVIKSPKYYFIDTGLLAYLLEIGKPGHISRDPLVGAIFENLVVVEILKSRYNQGEQAGLYFFRDSHGNEIDLLIPNGPGFMAIEIKSASTFNAKMLKSLKNFSKTAGGKILSYLIYSGESIKMSDNISLLNYREIDRIQELK